MRRCPCSRDGDRWFLAFCLWMGAEFHRQGGRGAEPDPFGVARRVAEALGIEAEFADAVRVAGEVGVLAEAETLQARLNGKAKEVGYVNP